MATGGHVSAIGMHVRVQGAGAYVVCVLASNPSPKSSEYSISVPLFKQRGKSWLLCGDAKNDLDYAHLVALKSAQ